MGTAFPASRPGTTGMPVSNDWVQDRLKDAKWVAAAPAAATEKGHPFWPRRVQGLVHRTDPPAIDGQTSKKVRGLVLFFEP